jgi:predicted metal-dependent phosphoesterase TrpH
MAGANFIRADLHVHTFPDDGEDGILEQYIEIAQQRDVAVLGVTDHNTTRNVRQMLTIAEGSDVLILPGIEISTHQGHLLALCTANEPSLGA